MAKASEVKEKMTIDRRNMLKALVGGCATASLTGCLVREQEPGAKGWVPQQYDAPSSWPPQVRGRVPIDPENPSIARDDRKCVLCGQCIEVCKKIQTVYGSYALPVKDDFICIHCGQCTLWCPTGAIVEADDRTRVLQALKDPTKVVIVQTAPSTRVGLGEEFGMPGGSWVEGQQVAALRRLGFSRVFDTNFAADLTIMEEGSELIERLTGKSEAPLPQLTSCCPGWVKFVEYYYPEWMPNLSTAKSPQQMLGAVLKTYYAKKTGIDPRTIFSVSVMPCTAKKFESVRPEFNAAGRYWKNDALRDIDAVLTVRELALMMKEAGLDFSSLPEESYDSLLGEGSGAALIFGSTGGVMEAAVRTAYHAVTGQKAPTLAFNLAPVRGLSGVKEASMDVPGYGKVRVAVAHGLHNARTLLDRVKAGTARYDFIEVMSCPGGCIGGGGMPRSSVPPADDVRRSRIRSLQIKDAAGTLRESHENQEVKELYRSFLGRPLSHLSHQLLHTDYVSRAKHLKVDPQALEEILAGQVTEASRS
ncbi:MAG: hydrogenase, Fe-only [Holophagaceae bacterium]|nr:hydrogenase, Fe-only [Holophagaceae bacterium]